MGAFIDDPTVVVGSPRVGDARALRVGHDRRVAVIGEKDAAAAEWEGPDD